MSLDLPALSAALLRLRPRARASMGQKLSLAVEGGTVSWVVRRQATRAECGEELVGFDVLGAGEPENERVLLDLLPEELVPVQVQSAGRRTVFKFRTQPGHFRCRDCGWGDGTDARGTHPGVCPECSAKRAAAVHGWRGPAPEPEEE